jgi:hypothetical protein
MWVITFMRSMPGRIAKVAAGVWLVAYGVTHPSLLGLVLMMAGVVPLVTGVAGICLLDEILKIRAVHRPPRAHEHRA